jgi:hypothetical protein
MDLLEQLTKLGLLFIAGNGQGAFIQTKPKVEHTMNMFGPVSEIEGKRLRLIERNSEGDCLCLFTGGLGQNLVSVDHRDIL